MPQVPQALLSSYKDTSGEVTDNGNYRSIALSSIVSKVLEHLLLNHMESFLHTSDISLVLK